MELPESLGCYPLSPMQAGMLFEGVLAPGSGVNIQQLVVSLPEDLDLALFESCWQTLAARHAVLRTSFRWAGLDEPLQQAAPRVSIPVQVEDLRGWPAAEQQSRIEDYLRADRRRGFHLATAPLLRVMVFRLGEAGYEVVWTFHHILLDGRSIAAVVEELFTLYDTSRQGKESRLEGRPAFSEFIEWLGRRDLGASREFWRTLLEGFTPPTPLGVSRAPTTEPDRGNQEIRVPGNLAAALRSFAAASEVTLNTLIQGAWAILLGRYGRSVDVVFGATRACRQSTIQASERLVGLCINTVPVRVRFHSSTSLLELLKDLRTQSVAVRPHEHTPLIKIKEWSGLAGRQPLFESIVVFERYSMESYLRALGGAWSSRGVRLLQQASSPLTLGVHDDDQPHISISYDRRRFSDTEASRMLGHFQTILEGIASGLHRRVGDLPLLTDAERRQVLVEWTGAKQEYPQVCIHELFEEQAARRPETVAVVLEGSRITYGELDRRANRIAHHLRSLGVGPECPVGLLAERSLDMVAGMLGVLKAGGAYVPLDPSYPADRTRFMLRDSGAAVALVQDRVDGTEGLRAVELDSAGQGFPETKPAAGVNPGNLAYIMYTSGSTGTPKGVEIEHRNVVGFLHSFRPFDDEAEPRIGTGVASFSFDTSVEEIFSCLCFGGTVHIIRPEHSTDARYFARYLRDHEINCTYIVPDMLEPVAGELARLGGSFHLRTVVTGLAPKRERALQAFRDLSPDLRILNAYGPTEVTYGATCYEFTQARDPDREAPIGKPFANYQVCVVDDAMQLAPVGIAGELWIGGVGVARGYRNQTELTREKFIPDPFGGPAGARLYRSGDLARCLDDGNLEFLGRLDEQVKIRGYRIEPGEIESALARHPGVARAAVTTRESPAGDARLVAYIVPTGAKAVTPADLRSFLRECLPEYMLPSAFQILEALPLRVSGKVDWGALPEPDWAELTGGVLPRDALEASLVRIWERVLRMRPVGIKDNFFDLGGHSLLAVRLFTEMERTFGKDLPLATLFQAPTIERLADLLRGHDLVPAWSALVPIQSRGSRVPFFAVHANGGHVLFYRELAQCLGDDQPFYGLQSLGLDGSPPLTRVEDMAALYLSEMRAVQPEGPYCIGGFCLGAYVALEMARQLEVEGHKASVVCFATEGSWRRVSSLREGFASHLERLSKLKSGEKAAYLLERLRFRWLRTKHRLAFRLAAVLLSLGRSLPGVLRVLYVFECNYQANLRHRARHFGGAAAYFHPDKSLYRRPEEFWREMARGGLEVHTVPGKDEDIFREPNVSVLAGRLRQYLDKVQLRG